MLMSSCMLLIAVVVCSKHNELDRDPEKLTSVLKSVLNQVKVRNLLSSILICYLICTYTVIMSLPFQ